MHARAMCGAEPKRAPRKWTANFTGGRARRRALGDVALRRAAQIHRKISRPSRGEGLRILIVMEGSLLVVLQFVCFDLITIFPSSVCKFEDPSFEPAAGDAEV